MILAQPLSGGLPEVKERRLANGVRVLVVPRAAPGALHIRLFLRGGRADARGLPAGAVDLFARSLFLRTTPLDLGQVPGAEDLLAAYEGAREALRAAEVRQDRAPGGTPTEELEGLRMNDSKARAALEALWAGAGPEAMDALGASLPDLRVEADGLSVGRDLPAARLEAWASLEAQRLKALTLARLPLEREAILAAQATPEGEDRRALDILLGVALPGQPYGRALALSPESFAALGWGELRAWARSMVHPERITLVLVGDVQPEVAWRILEATLGRLQAGEPGGLPEEAPSEFPEGSGARRMTVSFSGASQLFMAWRIPGASDPGTPTLQLLAQAMGGGAGSRLVTRLQEERRIAAEVRVATAVPGARDTGLFLIHARPTPGHSLAELEQGIQTEVLRIQRELFSEEELRRAQRQLEVEQLRVQEDAARLAREIGGAQVALGDWRRAFRFQTLGRNLSQNEVQTAARAFLVPSQATTVLLEPDPFLAPADPLERQLLEVLLSLVRRQVEDPARAEAIVRDSLRHLRMLSLRERERTLQLLQAQVAP